jgi:hypothetical protein
MKSVLNNLQTLRAYKKSQKKKRKRILSSANKDFIRCICECAENTLNSNVPLTQAQYQKLVQYKHILRRLCLRGEDWEQKREIINQSGGFILPLISPILAVLLKEALS